MELGFHMIKTLAGGGAGEDIILHLEPPLYNIHTHAFHLFKYSAFLEILQCLSIIVFVPMLLCNISN